MRKNNSIVQDYLKRFIFKQVNLSQKLEYKNVGADGTRGFETSMVVGPEVDALGCFLFPGLKTVFFALVIMHKKIWSFSFKVW